MGIRLRQTIQTQNSPDFLWDHFSQRIVDLEKGAKDFSYSIPESFLAFLDDGSQIKDITEKIKRVNGVALPSVTFVVGIGGANLASKAIYDAINSDDKGGRQMFFLDTLDQSTNAVAQGIIDSLHDKSDIAVVVVSKSGKTLETLANIEFLISQLEKKFGNVNDRIAVVSAKNSPLSIEAEAKGILIFSLPESLSDRFSAFSPTTLVPLAIHGFLFDEFLSGARMFRNSVFEKKESIPLLTSDFIHAHFEKGLHIYDLFFFAPHLETLGKWHRQLIGESLGKENASGEKKGITPTVSIGTTDLHSSLQLALGGPAERITNFVSIASMGGSAVGDSSLDLLPHNVLEKKPGEIVQIVMSAVEESYREKNLPFIDLSLDDVSLSSIGAYMVYAMFETVFLGFLWEVDVFSQPDVESYKSETRANLGL